MEQENWKDVIGYEGLYQVSNFGNIRALNYRKCKGKVINLKNFDNGYGYHIVNMHKNGKHRSEKVHRLVAISFLNNPDDLPLVNHINGIRNDNRAENLEWCTHAKNMIHAENLGSFNGYDKICRDRFSKKVINNNTGKIFNSALEAHKESKHSYGHFLMILNGKRKNHSEYSYYSG